MLCNLSKHNTTYTIQIQTLRPFYRLNTLKAVRRHFRPTHYEHFMYSWDAEPAYHANFKALYRLFLIIHHLTPSSLKSLLLIYLRKKSNENSTRMLKAK